MARGSWYLWGSADQNRLLRLGGLGPGLSSSRTRARAGAWGDQAWADCALGIQDLPASAALTWMPRVPHLIADQGDSHTALSCAQPDPGPQRPPGKEGPQGERPLTAPVPHHVSLAAPPANARRSEADPAPPRRRAPPQQPMTGLLGIAPPLRRPALLPLSNCGALTQPGRP